MQGLRATQCRDLLNNQDVRKRRWQEVQFMLIYGKDKGKLNLSGQDCSDQGSILKKTVLKKIVE